MLLPIFFKKAGKYFNYLAKSKIKLHDHFTKAFSYSCVLCYGRSYDTIWPCHSSGHYIDGWAVLLRPSTPRRSWTSRSSDHSCASVRGSLCRCIFLTSQQPPCSGACANHFPPASDSTSTSPLPLSPA